MVTEIKIRILLGSKAVTNLDSVLKSRDITLLTKFHLVKAIYGFSSSHVWLWKLDHKEGWAPKNWFFWTVVLEKTLESLLDSKEIKPVNPKGTQPRIFIGRTDAEAEVSILWPPDAKSWLIGKDPDAGKDWLGEGGGRGSITESMDMNLKNWEMAADRGAWWSIVGIRLSFWTTTASWSHTLSLIASTSMGIHWILFSLWGVLFLNC